MDCPYCGQQIDPGAIFCNACDACLLAQAEAGEPPPVPPFEAAGQWLSEYDSGILNRAQLLIRLEWLQPVVRELMRQARLQGPTGALQEKAEPGRELYLDALRGLDLALQALVEDFRSQRPDALARGQQGLLQAQEGFRALGRYMAGQFTPQELEELSKPLPPRKLDLEV